MSFNLFPKTGIMITRESALGRPEVICLKLLRIENAFRSNRNPYTMAGQSINADFLLYLEDDLVVMVGDKVHFSENEMYSENFFSENNDNITCEVKEQPIKYGFALNGFTGEVWLKTIN